MATKTIGTGGDYTSWASYVTYLQTLGTFSAPEIGQPLNGELTVSATVSLTGFTPTSSNPLTIEPANGNGFNTNANKLTNALRYNGANGAALTGSVGYNRVLTVAVPWVTIRGYQVRNTSSNGQGAIGSSGSGNVTIDDCITECSAIRSGHAALWVEASTDKARRVLVVLNGAGVGGWAVRITLGGQLHGCTIARPSNHAAGGTAINAPYNTATIQNTVTAGFTTVKSGGASLTGSGNATDQASLPSGLTGQTSLTMATEFEQPSNGSGAMDWRLKSTSVKCKDNGTTDITNNGTDIVGTARPQGSAYDIGAWELAAGGGSQTLTPSLFTNTQTFYGPTVTAGAVTLLPSLFTNANTFFGATVSGGASTAARGGGRPRKRKYYIELPDGRHRYGDPAELSEILVSLREPDEKREIKKEPPKTVKAPKRKKAAVRALTFPPVVPDTREVEALTATIEQLKAQDSQLQSKIAEIRALEEEEDFLMMVA